jgi:hypothetical protein
MKPFDRSKFLLQHIFIKSKMFRFIHHPTQPEGFMNIQSPDTDLIFCRLHPKILRVIQFCWCLVCDENVVSNENRSWNHLNLAKLMPTHSDTQQTMVPLIFTLISNTADPVHFTLCCLMPDIERKQYRVIRKSCIGIEIVIDGCNSVQSDWINKHTIWL